MNNFYSLQKKTRLVRYLCLISGLLVIGYTIYALLIQGEDFTQQTKHKQNNLRGNKFSIDAHKPIFEGVTKDNKQYKIQATRIIKNQENKYLLKQVVGECSLTPENKLHLKSEMGEFDDETKQLYLEHSVNALYNQINFSGSNIHIDVENKGFYTTSPIHIIYDNCEIKADSMSSNNFSNKVLLKGNVKSIIYFE
ncbi:MAG TPA: LPS export ABC transporter periplasmic protein LptC [Candidatus Megaira endosymbiont of Nemacystus decipiens]|nr:LPS export ABC transporter periplasmic protein LptC [Candidatus Megaera endosymbiont of Nemacystus decipiens]